MFAFYGLTIMSVPDALGIGVQSIFAICLGYYRPLLFIFVVWGDLLVGVILHQHIISTNTPLAFSIDHIYFHVHFVRAW